MDLLRSYIWLWVIMAIVFVCGVISIIFIFINKCISRQGQHRIAQLQRRATDFTINGNKYQQRSPEVHNPPLPPRTQFLTAEAQSYENLAAVSEYEEATHDYEDNTHDYEEATPTCNQATPTHQHVTPVYNLATPTYTQTTFKQASPMFKQASPNYEQDKVEQFEYVKVEDEEQILPPTYKDPDPSADDSSTEDYDDIGGEGESEEDYDDVG